MKVTITKFGGIAKYLLSCIIVAVLIILALVYAYSRRYGLYTDDASVQANIILLASQVDGKVVDLNIRNYQHVNKGQLLFKIDPKLYEYQERLAAAQLQQAIKHVKTLQASVRSSRALIEQRQADLNNAQQLANELLPLLKKGYESKRNWQVTVAELSAKRALLEQAQAQLLQAENALGSSGEDNADIKAAEAKLALAKLNLKRTTVYAPADAYITNLKLYQGGYATAGQPVLTLIEDHTWRVVANYKETALRSINVGDKAKLYFPLIGQSTMGTVSSIEWGSLREPASDNTGELRYINPVQNWVRLPQRFGVRIDFDASKLKRPLRVGATAEVRVIAKG